MKPLFKFKSGFFIALNYSVFVFIFSNKDTFYNTEFDINSVNNYI